MNQQGSLHGVSHANGGPFEIRSIDESTGELAWRMLMVFHLKLGR